MEQPEHRAPTPPELGAPRIVEKPWGREIIYAITERYAGKVLEVHAGQRLSLQYHERKSETMYVQRGRLRVDIGPDADTLTTFDAGPGAVIDIPSGTVHRIEAIEDSAILEVSTPDLDDVVRLQDDYGRRGTSAP